MQNWDSKHNVGVVGARSPVGSCLLRALPVGGWKVNAFSRQDFEDDGIGVIWRRLTPQPPAEAKIDSWIFLAHIWALPDYFPMLEAYGVRRIVALSSTSRFTKTGSSDPAERVLAERLAKAEETVTNWANRRNLACTILRPTLIYGGGRDRNISEMAAFIQRFGFFPLAGPARGLRQPVHIEDVAAACAAALANPAEAVRVYDISGGEILSYRDMTSRVFAAMGRPERLVPIPLAAIRASVRLARFVPRFRHWSPGMAERMSLDMVFDHSAATTDLGFHPRPFQLSAEDVAATG